MPRHGAARAKPPVVKDINDGYVFARYPNKYDFAVD